MPGSPHIVNIDAIPAPRELAPANNKDDHSATWCGRIVKEISHDKTSLAKYLGIPSSIGGLTVLGYGLIRPQLFQHGATNFMIGAAVGGAIGTALLIQSAYDTLKYRDTENQNNKNNHQVNLPAGNTTGINSPVSEDDSSSAGNSETDMPESDCSASEKQNSSESEADIVIPIENNQ